VTLLTRISLVGIHFEIALGELEGILRNDLISGEFAATHQFTGSAMTEDVLLVFDVGSPGG
jgi:hypothetical protein